MRHPLSAAVLLFCTACGSPTHPPGAASVRTEVNVVQARIESGTLHLTVPLVITNSGLTKLSVEPCGSGLERQEPGEWWSLAWGATCPVGLPAHPIEVSPGGTLRYNVSVMADVLSARPPTWPDDAIAGHYRVRMMLLRPTEHVLVPRPFNTSNVFEVQLQEE